MKSKILIILLFFVLKTIGQITPDIIPGDDNHLVALSPSGNYLAIVADGDLGNINDNYGNTTVPTDEGLLRVFHRNGDNTFSMTSQLIIPKGSTSSAAVAFLDKGLYITDQGDWYLFFQDDHISGVPHYTLLKGENGNTQIIDEFNTSIGVSHLIVDSNALYMIGTINGTPYLKKYNTNTNQLLWSINPGGISNPKIIKSGQDLYAHINSGLVKFDDATGANLGVVENQGFVYQINETGEVEYFSNETIRTLVFPDAETDWGEANFWWLNLVIEKWKKSNGKTFCLSGNRMIVLSDKLVHGFTNGHIISGNTSNLFYLNSHIFDDGSMTLITRTNDIFDIRHIEYPGDVVVPTLNVNGTNVHSVYDGKRYNGTDWVNVYERIGTIALDGSMPNVGDFADPSWVNVPSGYTLVAPGHYSGGDVSPVEEDADGNLFVRFVFYENVETTNLNNLRVYLINSSSLSIKNNLLSNITLFPNPVNNILTLKNAESINEITIYNSLGQIIINTKYPSYKSLEKNIEVKYLKKGVYTIQIKSELGIVNKHFIKL